MSFLSAATEPTKDEIEKLASGLDLTVVPSAEFTELSRAATKPTEQELGKLAAALIFLLFPKNNWLNSLAWLKSPQLRSWKEKLTPRFCRYS